MDDFVESINAWTVSISTSGSGLSEEQSAKLDNALYLSTLGTDNSLTAGAIATAKNEREVVLIKFHTCKYMKN